MKLRSLFKTCIALLICLSSLLIIVIFSDSRTSLNAVEPMTQDILFDGKTITKNEYIAHNDSMFGDFDWNQEVIIDGTEIPLLCVYSNPSDALEKAAAFGEQTLQQFEEEYRLLPFSDATWKDYRNLFAQFEFDSESKYDQKTIGKMMQFFDIYENQEINEQTLALVKNNKLSTKGKLITESDEIVLTLLGSLPTYSQCILTNQLYTKSESPQSGINNLSLAIDYASTYAENRNTNYTYYNGADCTNFASQIRYASGVARTNSWRPYTTSWINANAFAGVVGVHNITPIHRTFASLCDAGDFIAFDRGRDGTYDHIGFVTANDTFEASYSGNTYRDYKVAQHTVDYHAWTSSSKNSWEDCESLGYWYAELHR